eukprot:g3365.t1
MESNPDVENMCLLPPQSIGEKEFPSIFNSHTQQHSVATPRMRIGDEGARHIAKALVGNKDGKLTSLDIHVNKVGSQGATHIAEAIKTNQSIERIRIQGDWIPVASFRDGKITSMDLSNNGYGDLSAIIIASLLVVNTSLAQLDLHGNINVNNAGATAIAKALQVISRPSSGCLRYLLLVNQVSTTQERSRTVGNY